MTKNKSNQFRKAKYLLLIPLLASMLIFTSCSTEELESADKSEVEILKQKIVELKMKNQKQYELMTAMATKNKTLAKSISFDENDVPFAVIEHVPVFPGCTGTRKEKSDCLNSSIRKFVAKNFNRDLAKTTGLSKGKKKIWVQFRIDEQGHVVDAKTMRAPHPKLGEEAERVVKLLPKMIPGKQRDKIVGMKYTLPISFVVE